MTKLTKAQKVAIEKLSNMTFKTIPQSGEWVEDMYHHGINATTMFSLKDKGMISVSRIYLEGFCSADLVVLKTQ